MPLETIVLISVPLKALLEKVHFAQTPVTDMIVNSIFTPNPVPPLHFRRQLLLLLLSILSLVFMTILRRKQMTTNTKH